MSINKSVLFICPDILSVILAGGLHVCQYVCLSVHMCSSTNERALICDVKEYIPAHKTQPITDMCCEWRLFLSACVMLVIVARIGLLGITSAKQASLACVLPDENRHALRQSGYATTYTRPFTTNWDNSVPRLH